MDMQNIGILSFNHNKYGIKMKNITLICLIFFTSNFIAQQDTIYYDQETKNYIIQYLNDEDSLIIQNFIPWTKINPSITCKVVKKIASNEYYFNWHIKNEIDSEQNLNYFIIETKDPSIVDVSTSKWHSRRIHKPDGIGYGNRYKWYGDQGLQPSWQTNGFILSTYGLPTIGDSYFQGLGGSILTFSDPPPPEKIMKVIKKLTSFPGSYVNRPTIVPIKISSENNYSIFLDTLKYYANFSKNFNWITNQSTYDKYSKYLNNAKKFLSKEDTNFTIVCLERVLEEVAIDSSESITSEAFALLYFNTEYLINKLPEINIPDMFDRLIVEIEECQLSGSISNKGIYNSLKKKVENAKKSYEKGNIHSSVQKLKAFRNELRAQKDKHISIECTETTDEYSEIIIELLEE